MFLKQRQFLKYSIMLEAVYLILDLWRKAKSKFSMSSALAVSDDSILRAITNSLNLKNQDWGVYSLFKGKAFIYVLFYSAGYFWSLWSYFLVWYTLRIIFDIKIF